MNKIIEKLKAYNNKISSKIEYNKELNSKRKNRIIDIIFWISIMYFMIGIILFIFG